MSKIETSGGIDFAAVFDLIYGLANAADAMPLNQHLSCWAYGIDEQYVLVANPHNEPACWRDQEIEPHGFYVEYNGWPFAAFTSAGGWMGAGSVGNVQGFANAIEAKIALLDGVEHNGMPSTERQSDG